MAMTLRLSKDQTSRLRDAAIRENMSMQAIALRAVDDYLDKRDARRRELLAQILREDAGLLRRLADA
jgi:predicted transcriptional regulator